MCEDTGWYFVVSLSQKLPDILENCKIVVGQVQTVQVYQTLESSGMNVGKVSVIWQVQSLQRGASSHTFFSQQS